MTDKPKKQSKKDDSTFSLKLVVKKEDINQAYQKKLAVAQKNIKIDGFRPGKAPLDLVEKQIDTDKIIEDISQDLISQAYQKAIQDKKLKPIVNPQVKVDNPPLSIDKDWQLTATSCQIPAVKIKSKYKTDLKKVNTNKKLKKEELTQKIFDTVLANTQVNLPPVLIESELQRKFSQFVNQLAQAKLSLEAFLTKNKIKFEDLKTDFEKQIKKDWTINLAINHIAKTEKLTATQKEIQDLVKKTPQLSQNINMAYYLIEQQKVMDFLKKI